MYRGSAISAGHLAANRVYVFIYDGTDWELVGDIDTNSNTTNTAGSTDSSSKLFLIGATSQAAAPQTYSHDTAYVGTDGCLYSGGSKVVTVGGSTITGTLVLSKNTALSGTANNSPALIVGGAATAAHIEVDANDIQSKSNGTAVALLGVNAYGGNVTIGNASSTITVAGYHNVTGTYRQNGVNGRLASITSTAPSLTTANAMLWAW